MAKYAYKNTFNASTGLTPIKALMGYNSDFDIEMSKEPEPASQDAQKHFEELDALRKQLQKSGKQAQNAQENNIIRSTWRKASMLATKFTLSPKISLQEDLVTN